MPPSAPLPIQSTHQVTEQNGVVVSPSTLLQESSNNNNNNNDDDDNWNQSKTRIENHDAKLSPAQYSSLPSIPSTTVAPTTPVIQPPIDTGLNNMWNTSHSMMGMNPYNAYNPMTPSTSMFGNYGGFGNSMMMSPQLPMLGTAGGPFSTITNYLLGIQNVIMSIGQVVQIISFNATSLQQLSESILAMVEHAIRSWHEQQQQQHQNRFLKHNRGDSGSWNENVDNRTPEEIQKALQQRRRLRALRYTIAITVSYIGYTMIRKVFFQQQLQQQRYNRELDHSQLYTNHNALATAPPMYHASSHISNSLYPPPSTHYNHHTSNPYWNPVSPPLQQPSPYHHY